MIIIILITIVKETTVNRILSAYYMTLYCSIKYDSELTRRHHLSIIITHT